MGTKLLCIRDFGLSAVPPAIVVTGTPATTPLNQDATLGAPAI